MSEKKGAGAGAPAAGKKKPPMPLLIGVAVLLVGGGTFVFGQKVGAGSKKSEKEPPGVRLKLDEMVVNLKNPSQFVKATPEVEFKKPAPKGGGGEEGAKQFGGFVGRIEGAITLVFRATPVEKLASGEGIKKLERQMVDEINRAIDEPEGKVRAVTIGKFATQ